MNVDECLLSPRLQILPLGGPADPQSAQHPLFLQEVRGMYANGTVEPTCSDQQQKSDKSGRVCFNSQQKIGELNDHYMTLPGPSKALLL